MVRSSMEMKEMEKMMALMAPSEVVNKYIIKFQGKVF